jgi:hypothetical protein
MLKRLVLHVGQHKTGTKALQAFLSHNRRQLLSHGILYPPGSPGRYALPAYANSHYLLFALVRHQAEGCSGEAPAVCRPFRSVEHWFERLSCSDASTVVVSAEDLFEMSTAHQSEWSLALVEKGARLLAQACRGFGYQAEVLVYLRRPDHALGARYVQFIKGSSSNELDFEQFHRLIAPRLRYLPILEHWAHAFGRARVRVRGYDPCLVRDGIVADFFRHGLGIQTPDGCRPAPEHPESINQSVIRDVVELIRILNREQRNDVPRWALLELSQRFGGAGAGVAEWLSPQMRLELLRDYVQEHAEIAVSCGRKGETLFPEQPPSLTEAWTLYPGLQSERANAMILECLALERQRLSLWERLKRSLGRLS